MQIEKILAKYDGRSYEFSAADMDIDPVNPTDESVLTAVAMQIRHAVSETSGQDVMPNLSALVVDPPESERMAGQHDEKTVLNIRPSATFG